jgi:hypothetical protein
MGRLADGRAQTASRRALESRNCRWGRWHDTQAEGGVCLIEHQPDGDPCAASAAVVSLNSCNRAQNGNGTSTGAFDVSNECYECRKHTALSSLDRKIASFGRLLSFMPNRINAESGGVGGVLGMCRHGNKAHARYHLGGL